MFNTQRLLIGGLFVVGLLVGVFLGGRLYDHTVIKFHKLRQEVKVNESTLAEKEQQLVNLEIADKVNRLTQEKLREKVAELQTELVRLEGEVYLYKNLVEDDEAEIGLNLESFTLFATSSDNAYNYRIVVRQKAALSQTVEATLSLAIEGTRSGNPTTLRYDQVDPEMASEALAFKFKYFKVLEGTFRLPEGFVADKVVLSLYESGRADSLAIIERPWIVSGL